MPESKRQFVYFIRDADRQAIKIGIAIDPETRLNALQTGNCSKLELLGYVEGGLQLETTLHWQLRDHRILGEWFEEDAMMRVLDRIRVEDWVMLNPNVSIKPRSPKPTTRKPRHRNPEGHVMKAARKAKRQAKQHDDEA